MRVAMCLSYDGTGYSGWQVQPHKNTIQQVVQEAIEKLTGEKVSVVASGRTDAGVHAEGQVAHFDTNSTVPADKFAPALNTILPRDVRVLRSWEAEEGFHARFCAKKKTYRYTFYLSETDKPLLERYAAKLSPSVDIAKMKEAAAVFKGEHDFRAFLSSGSSVKTTVRKIYSSKVVRRGDIVEFLVTGNGFLYNMVRIMAGAVSDVGLGRRTAEDVARAVESGDRKILGRTLPAKGLTLVSVVYGGKKK